MLPNANDNPSLLFQSFCDELIPPFISAEFLPPKIAVIYGHVGMFWTIVPKTSINKNHQTFLSKNKIRFSKYWGMTPPACNAVQAEKSGEGQFGFLVTVTANAGHHFGTFRFGKDIWHCKSSFGFKSKPLRFFNDLDSLCRLFGRRGLFAGCQFSKAKGKSPLPWEQIVSFLCPTPTFTVPHDAPSG